MEMKAENKLLKLLYTIIGGCNFFYRRLNKINILCNLGESINPVIWDYGVFMAFVP